MTTYYAVSGQSFSDVCLNTYGTLDNYIKLLEDNNLVPDAAPYSNEAIIWNESIVKDQTTYKITTGSGEVFSTLFGQNTNNWFQVIGGENPVIIPINPAPVTPQGLNMYIKPLSLYYTATGGETDITIVDLQGMNILQIEREIKPLKSSEFIFNSITGSIQLIGINPLGVGETLFILYTQTITL